MDIQSAICAKHDFNHNNKEFSRESEQVTVTEEDYRILERKYILLQEELGLMKEELDRINYERNNKIEENLMLRDKIQKMENIFKRMQAKLSTKHEKWQDLLLNIEDKLMAECEERKTKQNAIYRVIDSLRKKKNYSKIKRTSL